MRKLVFALVLLAGVVAGQLVIPARSASAEVEEVTNTASNQFPNGIRFDFFFETDVPVTDVRLRFRILPDGVNATARPECTEGRVMNCQAVVGNIGEDTYMVPGAEVRYSWQVTDENGERYESEEQSVTYDDTRFQWQSVTEGNLTVYYYFGDENSARSVLNVASETVDRFSALLNADLDFPVKIWVYETAEEMQPAIASRRGQGNDNTIRTLGEVGASDTALVARDTEFLEIVRHELAHVVTGAATRDHLVEVPVWINEGLSTYAQNELLPNEAQALSTAIERNTVFPITSLGVSARGTGNAVSLFYAQSGSIVSFMIEEYGEDQFGEFIAALADDTVNSALESVYGFDQIGLENAWRTAVGLPEFDPNAPTPDVNQSQDDPTPTPGSQAQGDRQDPEDGDDDNRPAQTSGSGDDDGIPVIVIVLVALLVAFFALLGAAAYLTMRGRDSAA